MFLGLISCSEDEALPKPEVLPEVNLETKDTYKYIALRNDGQLFEVGNLTGKIDLINKIPGIDFNTTFNAITSSPTHLYIYEHKFPPLQSLIHIYNRTTKTSQSKIISFPQDVFGEFPGLLSLEWDKRSENLIGLIKEHYEQGPHDISRLARIDPVTLEITSMNIEVDLAHIISTQLIENNIYTSTYRTSTGSGNNDFFKIDLRSGALTSLELENMVRPPIHLSKNTRNNILFGFLPVEGSNFMGAARPVLINPDNMQVTDLFPNEVIGNLNFMGRSFFNPDSGEHVDFITSTTYFGLFHYNTSSQKVSVTHLESPNNLSSLVGIVDVRKVDK